jgi:hypothetical protein
MQSICLLLGASILGHFSRDEGLSGMWQPIFIGKACSTISDPINNMLKYSTIFPFGGDWPLNVPLKQIQ